jgi:hypothetical protein
MRAATSPGEGGRAAQRGGEVRGDRAGEGGQRGDEDEGVEEVPEQAKGAKRALEGGDEGHGA